MPPHVPRRSPLPETAALAALGAALVWLYWDVVPGLVRQWANDGDYSHGFFVVPLAAFFAWERREPLRAAVRRPSPLGLALLAAGLACYVAGEFGSELFLTRVSLIGVVAGLLLFLAGVEHARILAFPLLFLLLMLPLPEILFTRITLPLQTVASQLGEVAIAASGIPVLREGNVLYLPGRALEVAEACSGIRSLITLIMLAIVLGYFTEQRVAVRIAIVVAAVPIAVLANAIRVAGTGLVSYWVSPAAAEGFFHSFSGWIVFLAAFLGLLAFHRLVNLPWPRVRRVAEVPCS